MIRPLARSVCLHLTGLLSLLLFTAVAWSQPATTPTSPGTTPAPALSGATVSTPLGELLSRARELQQSGQHKAAYDLLQPRLDRYGGTAEFDYLLGISALDSGLFGQAILALERVLLVAPNNLQARAELARAYLANGETEAARRQFELVQTQQVPQEVRRVIDTYLAGIARAEALADTSTRRFVYAEMGIGWDSNVNFGSQSSQWLLADGTAVTPQAVSQPRSSSLLAATLGGSMVKPIGGNFSLIAGGALSHRVTPSAHTLDQVQMDINVALRHKLGCHESLMQTQVQSLRLDNTAFRNAAGVSGQWRCDVNGRTQVGAFLQGFDFTFPAQSVRNAHRNTLGLTFTRLLDSSLQPILVGSVYAGQERTRDGIAQLDHNFKGIRLSLNARVGDGWRGQGSVSWESRSFQGEEALFGVVREDRQTELRFGFDKDLDRHWTLAPQVVVTRNASTLAPNDFRRTQATLFARYRF